MVAILTGITYVVGWQTSAAYFRALGADWYIAQLGISRVVGEAGLPICAVAVSAYWSISGELQKPFMKICLRLATLIAGPFIFMILLEPAQAFIIPPAMPILREIILYCIATLAFILAGVEAGEWLKQLALSHGAWTQKATVNMAWAAGLLLIIAPLTVGKARAILDMELATTSLRAVRSSPTLEGKGWLFVDAIGERALFMRPVSAGEAWPAFVWMKTDKVELDAIPYQATRRDLSSRETPSRAQGK